MSINSVIPQFGDALGELKTTVSLVESPSDWLRVNINQIRTTVETFKLPKFSESTRSNDGLVKVPVDLIYPRFFIYMSAHLKLCTNNPRLLDSLKAEESKWIHLDEITQLMSHHAISDTLLWDFLRQCQDGYSPSSSARVRVEKLLKLDILCIAAQILVILYNRQQRKLLIDQKESQAQSLLDLLQALLDFPDLGRIRPPILRAIIELSKKSGLYPKCLILRGVQKQGQNPLYGGSFGDVWKGEVEGHAIAIKVMRIYDASAVDNFIKDFSHEAVLWRQLSHLHVLPFYGVYRWPEEYSRVCLVSPWMENGNITQYLKVAPEADRQSLMLDVARGLEYLHSFDPPVIHGDLKGVNILITPSLRACVTDLGLCTLAHNSKTHFVSTSSAYRLGTLQCQAPELLGETIVRKSLSSDIYSFGCLCYEVFAGRPRFSDLSTYQVIVAIINDRRPPRPAVPGLDNAMWDLIEQCWQRNPASRPTASDVVQKLVSQSTSACGFETACDWDATIVSRLYSTLADAPSVGQYTEVDARGSGGPLESGASSALRSQNSGCPIAERAASLFSTDGSLTSYDGDETRSITNQDIIIAILGPSGTGKSSFINFATGKTSAVIGHDLESCTQDVRAIGCPHPDGSGHNIVFVDTPGFDDSQRTDYDILRDIAKWLEQM